LVTAGLFTPAQLRTLGAVVPTFPAANIEVDKFVAEIFGLLEAIEVSQTAPPVALPARIFVHCDLICYIISFFNVDII
jgi:hypothetical protein